MKFILNKNNLKSLTESKKWWELYGNEASIAADLIEEILKNPEKFDLSSEEIDQLDIAYNILFDCAPHIQESLKEAVNKPVKLYVEFYPYERYGGGSGLKKATVSGVDKLDALKKLVDHMGLYIDSEIIEEEGYSFDDCIKSISMSNGDGCDFINVLMDKNTGEVFIDEGYNEEEDWDDDFDESLKRHLNESIRKYSVEEWIDEQGWAPDDVDDDEVAFFATESGPVCGSKHKDGTYSVFGLGQDKDGLSYRQMIKILNVWDSLNESKDVNLSDKENSISGLLLDHKDEIDSASSQAELVKACRNALAEKGGAKAQQFLFVLNSKKNHYAALKYVYDFILAGEGMRSADSRRKTKPAHMKEALEEDFSNEQELLDAGFEHAGYRKQYEFYRKLVDGKGKWYAVDTKEGKVFPITWDQAVGYEPIDSTEGMAMKLGSMLLPH